MSRGLNKVQVIGNLGAEPEIRHSQAGAQVTKIRIACGESWKGKDGETQERTEWVSCVFFGKLAEIAGTYLVKGSQVYVEGSLRTNKYQASDGSDRYSTEVAAREMLMLSGKGGDAKPSAKPKQSEASPSAGASDFDDDIPF